MFSVITLFWLTRTSKILLFWLYFWQLKEYHLGRLFAHFKTYKGKKLIFDPLLFFKLVLVVCFFLSETVFFVFPLILFLLYFIETLFFLRSFFGKKVKKPILTKKTSVLIFFGFLVLVLFPLILYFSLRNIFWFSFGLLIFDILTPKIVSIIVLLFQPFVFLMKKRILKKAKEKIKRQKNLTVIGITGSFGKSSTKEYLAAVLSSKFKVLKTRENQNSEIGIARCILNELKKEHQIFVCEIGAYNKGKIKEVCGVIKPKIGILTGINQQHMVTFGSPKNIVEGKYELIDSLPEDGLAFFNGENKYCRELFEKTEKEKRLYKFSNVRDIRVTKDNLYFKYDSVDFKIDALGKQSILNILASFSVARELGMNIREIKESSREIKQEQSGAILFRNRTGLSVIDSSYSANPTGVLSHLEHLKLWQGKKIVVMPCLIELGKSSKKVHQKIGEKIGKICDLAFITTKDRFREIKNGAAKSGMKEENILFLQSPYKIFEKIKIFRGKEDVVLLEGRIPKEVIKLLSD